MTPEQCKCLDAMQEAIQAANDLAEAFRSASYVVWKFSGRSLVTNQQTGQHRIVPSFNTSS
jgi:hypothetical protein